MGTPEYQPRLAWWSHLWRLLVAMIVGGGLWAVGFASEQASWLVLTDLSIGLVSLGLMFLRRRYPVRLNLLMSTLSVLSASSSGAMSVVSISLATRRRWTEIVPVAAWSLAMGMIMPWVNPGVGGRDPWWVTLTTNLVFAVAVVSIGLYIGSRRELLWTLRDRVAQAEREQSLLVGQARSTERARIAREMHDVLAHRISLVSMHAGALAYRTDLDPEQVRDSAGVIRDAANKALEDLRDVLGVLREDTAPRTERPQPTLLDLEDLVRETRQAGTRVSLDRSGDLEALPVAAQRTVYRVVQEGLTNARKHSPHSPVSLTLRGGPGRGVSVVLRNRTAMGAVPSPASGFGLVGLGERAELGGGWLRTAEADGDFVLEAWLPWTVDEAVRAAR